MRIGLKFLTITVSLLVGFSGETSYSDECAGECVGEVVQAKKLVTIEPGVPDRDSLDVAVGEKVSFNQTLRASKSSSGSTGIFKMRLGDSKNTMVKVRGGSVKCSKDYTCKVSGTARFTRDSKDIGKSDLNAYGVEAGDFFIRHLSTDFLVDARGEETSLYVMEGAVEVSSINPELVTKNRVVNAGEWLVMRNGEEIPPPMRYRRTDVVSGNSECIYSWCTLTRDVLPPPPPPPLTLPPPSPNPPGQR